MQFISDTDVYTLQNQIEISCTGEHRHDAEHLCVMLEAAHNALTALVDSRIRLLRLIQTLSQDDEVQWIKGVNGGAIGATMKASFP